MLLFTVGAGKKPRNSVNPCRAPMPRFQNLNDNYLLPNLKK